MHLAHYGNILEEELKNRVAADWFAAYDATQIIGRIDFAVAVKNDADNEHRLWDETEFLLWAEAKQGTRHDIYESFVQLILTIGKERTCDRYLPPTFLGAFDAEKIAFIPYNAVMHLFSENDFNWNVAPSNHETKEFNHVLSLVKRTLEENAFIYDFDRHAAELRTFIKANFHIGGSLTAISINKNNFTHVYLKWLREVKPSIAIDWDIAKHEGLIDGDFYLADLLSENNKSLKEKLFVLLQTDKYIYNITRRATGSIAFERIDFNDGQRAHNRFWKRYTRPPKEEYWDYICNRRDLLVPQDVRERKGSFFTPAKWVELSQEYIARELGEDWQDEYYVWDCCAGTGNLLAGLTNTYNIYASTLDTQDVKVMQDLIATNSLNLLASHVFQFDFLNDSFDKLPDSLKEIINDPDKRRKLVIYINPPYVEAASARQVTGTGEARPNVARNNIVEQKYRLRLGAAVNELFAQFFIRIYCEIPCSVLAEFSTLKILQAPNFKNFRDVFLSKLRSLFIVPADTFDNVKGKFPIGFHIWDMSDKERFDRIEANIFNRHAVFVGNKTFSSPDGRNNINDWYSTFYDKTNNEIGIMNTRGNDFQNHNYIRITSSNNFNHTNIITDNNLIPSVIYLTVRQCIEATWLNDRDQFFAPKDTWQEDLEFQSDCLAYTLFHGQNKITATEGVNHWIPFTEEEVGARERFSSHFMSDYLRGKRKEMPTSADLFVASAAAPASAPIVFSPEAQAVMAAGRELWRYYHSRSMVNPNASFYDIRLFFQGRNEKGKMNPDSRDERYTALIKTLRSALGVLAAKIAPKVYEHGFLLQ